VQGRGGITRWELLRDRPDTLYCLGRQPSHENPNPDPGLRESRDVGTNTRQARHGTGWLWRPALTRRRGLSLPCDGTAGAVPEGPSG
jgi:hypothetical protein